MNQANAIKTGLVAAGGFLTGAIVWLWMEYGTEIVLAYAQDIVMRCF